MPYDPALDKELAKAEVNVDGQIYDVSLRSYNGGDAKVSIALRDARFAVKRMTPKVFLAIAEVVKTMASAPPSAQDATPAA